MTRFQHNYFTFASQVPTVRFCFVCGNRQQLSSGSNCTLSASWSLAALASILVKAERHFQIYPASCTYMQWCRHIRSHCAICVRSDEEEVHGSEKSGGIGLWISSSEPRLCHVLSEWCQVDQILIHVTGRGVSELSVRVGVWEFTRITRRYFKTTNS